MSQRQSHLDFPLPPEILYDILLLLPFQSVLACKRISKRCKNIINDPDFSKKYRHKGSVILTIIEDNLYCILLSYNNNEFPSHTVHRLPITPESFGGFHELVLGWSNGVVCVKASNGYFHLYNLFTGVSHTVEDAPGRRHSQTWICYGFGYDCYGDDYKIMVLTLVFDNKKMLQNRDKTLLWVYSSKTDTWKKYDGLPYSQYKYSHNYYFCNGALHSIATKPSSGESVIVTCDLHTCRFGEISVPDSYKDNTCSCEFLTEVEGRLCFSYRSDGKLFAEVYGDGGRWVKWLSVKDPSAWSWLECLWQAECCDWGDGRNVVLLVFRDRFLWLDLVKEEVQLVCMTSNWLKKNQRKQVRRKKRYIL